jgi:hypothetical protein
MGPCITRVDEEKDRHIGADEKGHTLRTKNSGTAIDVSVLPLTK